eukprot:1985901-Alexandrium_andersonii.AAC.1
MSAKAPEPCRPTAGGWRPTWGIKAPSAIPEARGCQRGWGSHPCCAHLGWSSPGGRSAGFYIVARPHE